MSKKSGVAMTTTITCDSLEEYIKVIVKRELIGYDKNEKIMLIDKKNKIQIP